MQVDLLGDALPQARKGSLGQRLFSVSEHKAVFPSFRQQDGLKLGVQWNRPVAGLALRLAQHRLIVAECHSLLHMNQLSVPVDVLPAKAQRLAPAHARQQEQRNRHPLLRQEPVKALQNVLHLPHRQRLPLLLGSRHR